MSQNNTNMAEQWWQISKQDEYKRNSDLKESDVMLIREWLNKQPHLPQLTDNQIIMFLRVCDYSLEMTKNSIDLNYNTRTNTPQFFSQRDVESAQIHGVMDIIHIGVISDPDNNDCIITAKLLDQDNSKFVLEDSIKYCFMFHDMTHLEFGSCDGYVYIIDVKHVNLAFLLRLHLSVVAQMLRFWQDCSTYRIKAFHIINGSHVFKGILQIFQQFFRSELLRLMHLHDNFDTLKKTININLIPLEYGGLGKPLGELQGETVKLLNKYKDWFKEEENQRVDETKRDSSNTLTDESVQGSFRKLVTD